MYIPPSTFHFPPSPTTFPPHFLLSAFRLCRFRLISVSLLHFPLSLHADEAMSMAQAAELGASRTPRTAVRLAKRQWACRRLCWRSWREGVVECDA
ncbi:hypothetical protein K432DRAFT_381743 [Lepidopterella palustris CBS 459.81]|uniref:Uncharacterized protein n=1 Tax=Lepidopterella palustris CBS 459.81 TaxID=1314670 RepID=A0A8E2EBX2_9PEZI|nr:hypothetical protein K432DRAFT_381743 [Lepidopterella palustris CBS 459.81]